MQQTANTSPEDQAKGIEAWMTWAKNCGDKLVSMGNPLANGLQLNPDGTDTASKKEVVGFSILQAGNIDEAKSLLQGHPHLGWNASCSIELHETMPLPGM
jgi:hypothetical protein